MGKKYIIKESQERLMFQLIEAELGPEESVLIARKNPFADEKYVNARKLYSSSMRDGELFFTFNNNKLEEYFDSKLESTLNGKTIRITFEDGTDTVVKFVFVPNTSNGVLIKGSKNSLSSKNLGTQALEEFAVKVEIPGNTWKQNPNKPIIFFNSSKGGFYEITGEKYRGGKGSAMFAAEPITLPDKTKINNAIFAFSSWNKIPDEFFEVRKVKKQKTDF